MSAANTQIKNAVFRIIDVEGTDRDPNLSHAVEVAYRRVRADGTELHRSETLIDPGVPIPPSASAIHHIVDADVAGKPKLEHVMLDADRQFDAYVAHGADYDKTVLKLQDHPWICTHRLAKHLWPEIENHSNQEIRYTLKLHVDLPKGTPHHRAAADVAVTAAIFKAALPLALAKWPDVETVGQLIEKTNAPALLLKIPFKTAQGQLFEHATTDHLEWIVRTGAGGADCVFTASHWLDQRDIVDADFFPDEEE